MFWNHKKESISHSEPIDCSKEAEIEKLKSELEEYKRILKSLKTDVEQGYVKDTLPFGKDLEYKWVEVKDKFGDITLNIYKLTYRSNGYFHTCASELIATYSKDQCLRLRDFLVKNFGSKEVTDVR